MFPVCSVNRSTCAGSRSPVISVPLKFSCLSVHQTCFAATFLPGIIETDQTGHRLVRQLQEDVGVGDRNGDISMSVLECVCSLHTKSNKVVWHHLLDAVEALPMETEGLFEENSVLHRPLVGERSEVWQVCQRFLDIVFVPE